MEIDQEVFTVAGIKGTVLSTSIPGNKPICVYFEFEDGYTDVSLYTKEGKYYADRIPSINDLKLP